MSIGFRPMRPGQEEAVATFIRQLPKDVGLPLTPLITGETLRQWQGQVHVMIADNAGLLCGICVWFFTYSTWRGAKGAYISDLYVMSHLRHRKIGHNLVQATARDAARQGARFLRLDVTTTTPRPRQFYERLGFVADGDDLTLFLEPDVFQTFIAEKSE